MGPGVHRICLDNEADKCKLLFRPPVGVPNLLQPNRVMSPAVHFVDTVLAVVVAGEILGVVKADPCSFFWQEV